MADYPSRLPVPDPLYGDTWKYGPQEPHDDFSVILNGLGKQCKKCKRVTMNKFIKDGLCPDCAK